MSCPDISCLSSILSISGNWGCRGVESSHTLFELQPCSSGNSAFSFFFLFSFQAFAVGLTIVLTKVNKALQWTGNLRSISDLPTLQTTSDFLVAYSCGHGWQLPRALGWRLLRLKSGVERAVFGAPKTYTLLFSSSDFFTLLPFLLRLFFLRKRQFRLDRDRDLYPTFRKR